MVLITRFRTWIAKKYLSPVRTMVSLWMKKVFLTM